MKKRSNPAPRVSAAAPFCSLAAAGASLAAAVRFPPVRIAAGTAGVFSLCAAALGFVLIRRARAANGELKRIAASSSDDGAVDLAGFAAEGGRDAEGGQGRPWLRLMESLNEDIALLQRSAVKFDLFSSDILFSAQHLAGLAGRDLDMLAALRRHVVEFFQEQSRTNEELGQLRQRMTLSADQAAGLSRAAEESRAELSALVDLSRETARDAGTGKDEVEATDGAAEELGRGLARLDAASRREAEEADRIAESLAGIADIVERTHILATNASIEAARAGAKGSGFAVIAAEVRSLSESSRKALEGIDKVLRSVTSGIRDSSALAAQVSGYSENLSRSLARTRAAFDAIGNRIREVESRLERFDGAFSEQIEGSTRSSESAEEAAALLEGFTKAFGVRTTAYEAILEATRESEASVHDAARSARVLAQLAGYLKNGGLDRNRVLRKYKADDAVRQRRLGRRERREELLYNLEVFGEDGNLLGHLGDLSRSGLLLVSSRSFEPGTGLALRLELPITAEGERSVSLRVTVRRTEEDCGSYRLGCSIDERADTSEQVEEVLRSLSLGGVAAPGAASPAPSACSPEEDAEAVEEIG